MTQKVGEFVSEAWETLKHGVNNAGQPQVRALCYCAFARLFSIVFGFGGQAVSFSARRFVHERLGI